MFKFFAKIGAAIAKAWKAADTLQKISYVFSAVTAAVGVKGYLQARQMLAKGQDIMANKTAAGGKIPVIYGTRRVGAQVVYMDTKFNRSKDLFVVYALAVGECEEILGRTIEIDGNSILDGKIYKGGGYVGSDKIGSGAGSLNTASQVGDVQYSSAGNLGTDPTLRYSFVFNLHHGATSQTADPMLRASIPEAWSTNHKLNGICYIAAAFDYDKKGMYKGVPQITVQVKGKKVYDPRTTTTAWSSNAALCFLDYIQNDEYGKGLATADINMSTFETAADKCDVLQNQPFYGSSYQNVTWSATSGTNRVQINTYGDAFQNKVDEVISIKDSGGTLIVDAENINSFRSDEFYDEDRVNEIIIDDDIGSDYDDETGSIFTQVKRFHCNGYVDTNKNVMDNAKELLANMRGIFTYINGKYELQIEDTGTSTFSITDNHIIAESGISVDYGNKDKKANKVIVEFFNANLKYELDTVTELHDATPNYYSDDGEILEVKAEFPYITDPYIASNMAKAILGRSRNQKTVQFLGTPEMYKLNVGDIVDLTYAGLGFDSDLFRIEALELQSNGLVSVSMIEYLDIYTWDVPTQEETADPVNLPTAGALAAPENVTFTDTDASSISRPTLSWTEPTDFPVKEFRVDVTDSSSNAVISKIVDTNSADLSFVPKGSNYNYSVTSINGLGIESDATTGTFTIADDPVKTTEVEIGSETLSNIIDYGTITGYSGNWFQINGRLDLEDRFVWNSNGDNYWSLGTSGDDDINLRIQGSAGTLIQFKDQNGSYVKLSFGDDVSLGTGYDDRISLEADYSNSYNTVGTAESIFYIKGNADDGSLASGTIATFTFQAADGVGIPSVDLPKTDVGGNLTVIGNLTATGGDTEFGDTNVDGDLTVIETLSVQGIINANTSSIRIKNQTPASASATGTTGTIVYDSNYIYVCVATNTWKRVAISTW